METFDLAYELRKCTECSCSRCNLCGTPNCFVEIAIKKLSHYEQAMDSLVSPGEAISTEYDTNP